MPDTTENADLIQAAREAVNAQELYPGIYWTPQSGVVDIRSKIHADAAMPPDRKTGRYIAADPASFTGYLDKHALEWTELWGNRDAGTIRAVINAHNSALDDEAGEAGHQDHSITLTLRHSDDWKEWTKRDGEWVDQETFAEHVEDHLPNFGKPSGAEMLELARSFKATQKVEFGATQHAGGATTLSYTETKGATHGKGGVALPDRVTLGIHVYDQGEPYAITARLRYRVKAGELLLSYRLERPKGVLQQAFTGVVGEVEELTCRAVWHTTS